MRAEAPPQPIPVQQTAAVAKPMRRIPALESLALHVPRATRGDLNPGRGSERISQGLPCYSADCWQLAACLNALRRLSQSTA